MFGHFHTLYNIQFSITFKNKHINLANFWSVKSYQIFNQYYSLHQHSFLYQSKRKNIKHSPNNNFSHKPSKIGVKSAKHPFNDIHQLFFHHRVRKLQPIRKLQPVGIFFYRNSFLLNTHSFTSTVT